METGLNTAFRIYGNTERDGQTQHQDQQLDKHTMTKTLQIHHTLVSSLNVPKPKCTTVHGKRPYG